MKVVAIIPARLKSARFEEKLIRKLLDKQLIIHVYDNIKNSSIIDDTIVATDSEIIMDLCKSYNAKCVMTSDKHISGTSRIIEVAKNIEADIIINVQGDEPLIDEETLKLLLEAFNDDNVDIATLKTKIKEDKLINDTSTVKVVCDINGYAMYFSRATIPFMRDKSDKLPTYYKHIGVYAFRRDKLLATETLATSLYEETEKLEQLGWLYNGMKIKVLETDKFIHGIDTKEDLDYVESFLRNKID